MARAAGIEPTRSEQQKNLNFGFPRDYNGRAKISRFARKTAKTRPFRVFPAQKFRRPCGRPPRPNSGRNFGLRHLRGRISPFLGPKCDFRDFGMWPNRAYLGTFGSGPVPKLKVEGRPRGRKIDFAPALPKRTKWLDLAGESTRGRKNANGREFAANWHLRFLADFAGYWHTKIGRPKWGVPVGPENGFQSPV